MSIYTFADIHTYNLVGQIIECEIGTKHIWAILSSGHLMLIHRNDIDKYKLFHLYSFDSVPPKLVIDDTGDKCAIIYPQGKTFYATSTFTEIKELNIPQIMVPCCGTWVKEEGKNDTLVMCSSQGAIFQLWPGKNERCGFLYYSQKPTKIEEIHILLGKINFVFILLEDSFMYFQGTEPYEILLSKGANDNCFILPPLEQNIHHRMSVSKNEDGLPKVAVVFNPGFITYSAYMNHNNILSFKQELYDEKATIISCIEQTPWGILEALHTEIKFFSESKTNVTFAFPYIDFMSYDENELILVTFDQIVLISVEKFREVIANEAIEQSDFDYAKFVGGETFNPREMIIYQIGKLAPKEGAHSLLENNWKLDDIMVTFSENKRLLICVLDEILGKINYNRAKHRSVVSYMIITLYCQIYPQEKESFEKFIEKQHEYIDAESTYKIFEDYNADEMIEKLALLKNDQNKLVSYYIETQNTVSLLDKLQNEYNAIKVRDILIRLLPFAKKEVGSFLVAHNTYRVLDMVPILVLNPEIACTYIDSFFMNDETDTLMYVSLCMMKKDAQIIQKMLYGCSNPEFVLRLCLTFGCDEAASHVWLDIGRIDKAVEKIYSLGYAKATELLSTVFDDNEKRIGWYKLLQIANEDDRKEALSSVLGSGIFTFEELLDFVDDSELTIMFEESIIGASKRIKETTDVAEYKKVPDVQPLNDLSLTVNSECILCNEKLFGSKFYVYPCGHCAHEKCVKRYVNDLIKSDSCDSKALTQLDASCPRCSFIAIPSVLKPM